mmetsp:Transcript_6244/g.24141  ORF Transcript_6244/g.24141 Transcript_6244/m.24141 type:complete len:231 (+) Transcript_6244:77-769(+)
MSHVGTRIHVGGTRCHTSTEHAGRTRRSRLPVDLDDGVVSSDAKLFEILKPRRHHRIRQPATGDVHVGALGQHERPGLPAHRRRRRQVRRGCLRGERRRSRRRREGRGRGAHHGERCQGREAAAEGARSAEPSHHGAPGGQGGEVGDGQLALPGGGEHRGDCRREAAGAKRRDSKGGGGHRCSDVPRARVHQGCEEGAGPDEGAHDSRAGEDIRAVRPGAQVREKTSTPA